MKRSDSVIIKKQSKLMGELVFKEVDYQTAKEVLIANHYSGKWNSGDVEGAKQVAYLYDVVRIRKLTPLECWRLQGFTDVQFYKAKNAGVSNSQLYKQAGNSVTVNVIEVIAKTL